MSFLAVLRHLLRGRHFRELFAVRVTSQCGDGIFQVAFASYVLFSPESSPTRQHRGCAGRRAAAVQRVGAVRRGVPRPLEQAADPADVQHAAACCRCSSSPRLIAPPSTRARALCHVVLAFSINRFFLAGLSAALPHVVDRDELVLANSVTPTAARSRSSSGSPRASRLRRVPRPSPMSLSSSSPRPCMPPPPC